VNILGIGGIVLAILGIIILVQPDTLNYIVALAFIVIGLFGAARGFGIGGV
jgi:membrane-bound ClpP family serine protease